MEMHRRTESRDRCGTIAACATSSALGRSLVLTRLGRAGTGAVPCSVGGGPRDLPLWIPRLIVAAGAFAFNLEFVVGKEEPGQEPIS